MKIKAISVFCALTASVFSLSSASSFAETVTWKGSPIPVVIQTGAERRIDFPEPVALIDVAEEAQAASEIRLMPDGKLFWKAKDNFSVTRALVTSTTGSVYLLDVSATAEGKTELLTLHDPVVAPNPIIDVTPQTPQTMPATVPLQNPFDTSSAQMADQSVPAPVTSRPDANASLPPGLPDFLKQNHATTASASSASTSSGSAETDIGYIEMARFALAHFTGPKRLIPDIPASKAALKPVKRPWIRALAARVQAKPIGAWLMNGKYVTVIFVRNLDRLPLDFDPRALRGEFEFAASLHSQIQPAGTLGDESLWVIISKAPFHEAAGRGGF